jgi:hypothetical protein
MHGDALERTDVRASLYPRDHDQASGWVTLGGAMATRLRRVVVDQRQLIWARTDYDRKPLCFMVSASAPRSDEQRMSASVCAACVQIARSEQPRNDARRSDELA